MIFENCILKDAFTLQWMGTQGTVNSKIVLTKFSCKSPFFISNFPNYFKSFNSLSGKQMILCNPSNNLNFFFQNKKKQFHDFFLTKLEK